EPMVVRRQILAASIVASASISAAFVLDACATGGIIADDNVPETGGKDSTVTPGDGGDAGCGTGLTDCNGKCVNTASDPKNCGACGTACNDASVCSQSACALNCGGGTTKCGQACVDIQTDPQNCSKCGAACPSGDFCDGGTCIPNCTSVQKLCDD